VNKLILMIFLLFFGPLFATSPFAFASKDGTQIDYFNLGVSEFANPAPFQRIASHPELAFPALGRGQISPPLSWQELDTQEFDIENTEAGISSHEMLPNPVRDTFSPFHGVSFFPALGSDGRVVEPAPADLPLHDFDPGTPVTEELGYDLHWVPPVDGIVLISREALFPSEPEDLGKITFTDFRRRFLLDRVQTKKMHQVLEQSFEHNKAHRTQLGRVRLIALYHSLGNPIAPHTLVLTPADLDLLIQICGP